jgi:hypothetical protein
MSEHDSETQPDRHGQASNGSAGAAQRPSPQPGAGDPPARSVEAIAADFSRDLDALAQRLAASHEAALSLLDHHLEVIGVDRSRVLPAPDPSSFAESPPAQPPPAQPEAGAAALPLSAVGPQAEAEAEDAPTAPTPLVSAAGSAAGSAPGAGVVRVGARRGQPGTPSVAGASSTRISSTTVIVSVIVVAVFLLLLVLVTTV